MASHPQTVLVVEDDPLIRLYLAECLEDEGYAVGALFGNEQHAPFCKWLGLLMHW
jgi:CheY-like chemotaxis protein